VSRVPVQQLTCYQGDDWSIQPVFTLVAGTLAGCKIWLTVKAALGDADPGLVQIDTTVGGVVIDDATHATFTLTAAQTAALPAATHWYDIQILLPNGKKYTSQSGRFLVTAQTTRATA
jgi:hypothetical protein